MLRATQLNHSLSQIRDAYRITHIEDIDFTTITHRTRFQNQFTSFWNKHEITDYIRMRYRDGTTVLDLLTENRNDRTIAAQHITEAGCHKLSNTLHFARLDGLIQTLHINFTYTLAASHHIGRVHRFVRAHHHKLLGTILYRQVCHHTRTIDIVLHRLTWIILHHRHMLISRCMKHILRTELLVYLFHARCITDACHDGMSLHPWMMLIHIQTHIVHRSFCLVNQNQLSRMIDSHLANHLATDTTSRTCDKDTLISQHTAHLIHIDFNLLTR